MGEAYYGFGEVSIISRGGGKSSVASAAYHAGMAYTNDYDGVTHDFTKKEHVGDTFIRMPESCPAAWRDESVPAKERLGQIWNDVERAAPADNARLARQNWLAIPYELTLQQGLECVDQWIKVNCTDLGMGVTYSVHDQPNNPHVDLMYLVSEFDSDGKQKLKSRKEYLCRNGAGEECYLDADALAAADKEWEKVYKYRDSAGAVVHMTPSEVAKNGGEWVRVNKYAVCRTVKVSGWDDDFKLVERWRKSWEEVLNAKFLELGIDSFVDCRSNKARGKATLATVHEGWGPDREERRAYNSQVRHFNQEVEQLATDAIEHTMAIAGVVNSLQHEPQTPESLDAREKEFKHHESMLQTLAKSELLPADRPRIIRDALQKLGAAFSRLLQRWKEYFIGRSRQKVQEAFEEAQEATSGVRQTFEDILSNASERSAATASGISRETKDFDKV